MLKEQKVEYDWLYVSSDKKFQQETFVTLGFDLQKIIQPVCIFDSLQADELIVPSLPARRILDNTQQYRFESFLAYYYRDWVINYLRNKFLPLAEKINIEFSKKIFISRKDAMFRIVENEDEVFALFEKRGFVKYICQIFLFASK